MVGLDDILQRREDKFSRYRGFLVFDIETVVDRSMLENVAEERDIERFERGEFMHPAYHRIVAVSLMGIRDGDVVFFESHSSRTEHLLLHLFWEGFMSMWGNGERDINFPVLITVNGKEFDVPVILLRSLAHADMFEEEHGRAIMHFTDISAERYDPDHPHYTSKFTRYHIDLGNDIFGRKVSLRKLAYLSGIPVKEEGKGKEVRDYFDMGDMERIARYCAEDVKATALIFSRINSHLYGGLYRSFPSTEVLMNIEPEIRVI